jgi:DNA-directed RNA polymerase specialized sigma54-like protein
MIPFERKMLRILGASRRDLALLVQGELRANPLLVDGHVCLARHLHRLILTERESAFGAQVLGRLDQGGFFRSPDGRTIQDLARDVELGPESSLDAMWLTQEFAEELCALDPLPVREGADPRYTPIDVYVVSDGAAVTPRYDRRGLLLRIDDMRARSMLRDPQAKDIAEHYLARGQWLIRSLAMRRTLLMQLVDWLVAEKRDAFEKGATFVDGADWRDASQELGIDLEAAFVLVENKLVHTPLGTTPLGSFFYPAAEAPIVALSTERIKRASMKKET